MDSLIKTLPKILQAAGDSPEVLEAACIAAWKHAAGDGLRDHAVPLRLNGKTLVVMVADATWQKQLQSLSSQLLFRLNSILGQPLVAFVDFRVNPNAVANARGPQANRTGRKLDPETVPVELVTAAASIEDKDLRRAFLGAAMSCIKRLE
jgi:predicted nucleic acid-binding Zn ribbon protein